MTSLINTEVLIIEDAADFRMLARKLIEGDGGTAFEVDNIEDGLTLARQKAPHLILTDLNLPGKSGFDLLEIRKSSPELSQIPTIVMSGMSDKPTVYKALSLGATDYILKPFQATLFLQKIKKALKKSSFRSVRFKHEESIDAQLSVAAEILMVNESGLLVESPLKLANEEEIKISSDLLRKLECSHVIMRTNHLPAKFVGPSRYINEISFVGVSEKLAKKMRLNLKEIL